jgi:hypothetical protein
MAKLAEVIPIRRPTIAEGSGGNYEPLETMIEKVLDKKLPAKIAWTPWGELPARLARNIRGVRITGSVLMERALGRVSPKTAGLIELRNAAADLQRKLHKLPRIFRQRLIQESMRHAAERRNAELTIAAGAPYSMAAEALNDCSLEILIELLESGLQSLCAYPKQMTKKEASMQLRKVAVMAIHDAFKANGRKLNKDQLVTVCRALASFHPREAGLESIKSSTVRDIFRYRRQISSRAK